MEKRRNSHTPELSVIIISRKVSRSFLLALENLRNQTISRQIEVIIVTESSAGFNSFSQKQARFFDCKIIERKGRMDHGSAKAKGLLASTSPLVAFTEDHSFPHPEWAEALVKAHRKNECAVVGPVVLNANGKYPVSWGCFLVLYGEWMKARPSGENGHLPANQSCYKRSLLLEYGHNLEEMLMAESILHWDLIDKGYSLHQEPGARTYHMNFSKLGPVLTEYYLSSRIFAVVRSSKWGTLKRIAYALGSPTLPLIRLPRIIEKSSQAGLASNSLIHYLPSIVLTLCAGTLGEMLGYSMGYGKARNQFIMFEKKIHTYFSDEDIAQIRALVRRQYLTSANDECS